jgi:CDP-diacylglycerol---glycerol-3-phosphate 3-phosphatidyltransferase
MNQTKPDIRRRLGNPIGSFFARILARTGVSPNTLTVLGFLATIAAGIIIGYGHFIWGAGVIALAGLFDLLDGALARYTGKVTVFGAILDSTLDRLSDAALLIGLAAYWTTQGEAGPVILTMITLAGALTVSYIRARAEAAGLSGKDGIFTRPERIIVLALGLLFSVPLIAVGIIGLFSYVTILQRLVSSYHQTGGR